MEKMERFFPFKASGKNRLKIAYILLLFILALGFLLRIYKIKDYIVFLGDEGRDALVTYGILHGDLTLLGPTSSVGGFFLGPIYYYMISPFLWLWGFDPVGPAVMVVLFGIATILLVYIVGKEFFGKKAGLIASLLYAISPIVIIYSRSSWNPNVFPFFTIASLFALYKAVEKKNKWLFIFSGFLMGINLQIHYLATFVGTVMFFYVFFVDFKLRLVWFTKLIKRYGLMLAGFLIGFSPFLAFEFRHQFTNTQNIVRFVLDSPDTGVGNQILANIQHVFLRLFGGLMLNFPLSSSFKDFDPALITVWWLVSIILGLLATVVFLGFFIKKINNKSEFQKYFLIFVWGALGIGLFAFYKKPIFDYYLGFLFPLPFLLIGLLLSNLSHKIKKIGTLLMFVVLLSLVFINLKYTPISRPGNNQVLQVKLISDFVLSKTEEEPFNFALMSGGNSDHAYRYFFKLSGRDPVVIEGLDVDPQRNSVTNQLLVICEKSVPCAPLGYSLWEVAGFGRAEIDGHWEYQQVEIFKLVHYGEE